VESRSYASVREILARIRKKQFSAAVDYQGLWKSATLPFLGRVPRRIGFSSDTIREFGVPLLYTDRVRCTRTHIADQNGELSQRAGARNGVASVALSVSSLQEAFVLQLLRGFLVDRYVVVSPAGGWRSKCWPPERYGALCLEIHKKFGLRCILNYGPGEEGCAAAVKAASGDSAPIDFSGSLSQLVALLRNALCIVAGDTGPLHLGVALGVPVVALFGPTNPARNGPYPPCVCAEKQIVLRSAHAETTHTRKDQPDPSLLELDIPTVFDAVRRQIEARR
jgi:ADP-heptose:LPS heptosyltransferase